ncbi:extracellular solute-binding protein [Gracilibacillus sp. JCM 18860]|uniref:extracellular solute-binding protein n=1 Tax=Gracilibacillus sp. JCM 18860 TaxID=1306159 RepID=UPI000AA261C6
MKKLMVLLISFSMVIVLTACNSDKETSEEQTDSNGKTKMTVFMPESDTIDLETNSFTKFAEEEFGINFEFETTSMDGAAAKERRQISLASGDYPDVYFLTEWVDQFKANDLLKYGKQGVLIPLNDLIEEHAPNLQKVLEEHEEFRKITVAPDGNIYGIPQLEECFHCTWPNKMWINTDWLEKLDLSIPETHEEFKNVLTAFNEQDPQWKWKIR